ncbi:MAG: ribosomal protein S18-alanine N-acetyltransferase [Thermoplasmata archaeon]
MQTGKGDYAFVRKFRESDLDAVVELANSTLTEYYGVDLIYDLSRQWPDGFLIYQFGDNIVGFLAGSKYSSNEARILLLAVEKSFRKMGIGTTLVNDFTKLCMQLGMMSVRLEVRVDNIEAINFYRKLKFVVISTMRNYYSDSSDAHVMWRLLSQ